MKQSLKISSFLFFIILFQYLYISKAEASTSSEQMSFARKAFARNDFAKAVSHIDLALKEKPNMASAWLLRSKCNIEMDMYNQALDDINKAYNIDPQESEFLYYKGVCEWKLKRISSCVQSLEKSLLYDPSNFLTYEVLGSMYFEMDMISLAKENFDKAIDIQPDFSLNVFNKNKIDDYVDYYKTSLRLINRETKKNPSDYRNYFFKGILKAIAGDNWGAYLEFDQCTKIESNTPIMFYYKAFVEYNIKKFDLALIDLSKYSKNYPTDESVNNLITVIKEITNMQILFTEDENGESSVYTFVEQMPEFKGGQNALYQYISQNIRYPKIAMTENIEGRVVISFVVDAKGYVGNIEVIKAIGGGCEEEAIRVVTNMPRWNSGKQNGKNVSVRYTLPIAFKLATID